MHPIHRRYYYYGGGQSAEMIANSFKTRVEADGGVYEANQCLIDRIQSLKDKGFWDYISAAWIPHGYKESKLYAAKGGANADLGFTRGGTRTRKGPTYVEQVPYNLVPTNSNTFSGWASFQVTLGLNSTTAPDNSNTASLLRATATAGAHSVYQANIPVDAGTYTFSTHVKYYNQQWVAILLRSGSNLDARIWFDVQNGIVGTTTGASGLTGSITADRNGYYRITVTRTLEAGASGAYAIELANANGSASFTGTGVEGIYIWGGQFVTGTLARDYLSITDRLNVPALDYTGSTCPALSLEPARTNLLLHSEDLTNAAWVKTGCSITANDTAAPDNLSTADRVVDTGTGMFVKQVVTVSATTTYTFSTRVKKGNKTWMYLSLHDGVPNGKRQWFNLDTGAAGSSVNIGAGLTTGTPKIRATANGFYELEWSVTTAANTTFNCIVHPAADGDGVLTNALSDYGWFWGSQLEQASYATSYIPTTTATVSRIADTSPMKSMGALIGQSEGTIYVEVKAKADGVTKRIAIDKSTDVVNNRVLLHFNTSNQIELNIVAGGVVQALITTPFTSDTNYKIAITYGPNYAALTVNGVKIGEDLTVTVPACDQFGFQHNTSYFFGHVKAAVLSKTRISDAEAITLTTP